MQGDSFELFSDFPGRASTVQSAAFASFEPTWRRQRFVLCVGAPLGGLSDRVSGRRTAPAFCEYVEEESAQWRDIVRAMREISTLVNASRNYPNCPHFPVNNLIPESSCKRIAAIIKPRPPVPNQGGGEWELLLSHTLKYPSFRLHDAFQSRLVSFATPR